jgi:hypothetical protein
MAIDTIFQATILTNFIYPFLLLFFLLFAILEKTKLLGSENTRQLNALISVIISLIFVGAVFPKIVVGNLVLFLAVGVVVIFVIMLLWGFVAGKDKIDLGKTGKVIAVLIILGVILVILGSIGFGPVGEVVNKIGKFMFNSGWSSSFWTNALFVIIVAVALAIVLKSQKK